MELVDLVGASIVTDLNRDPGIARHKPREHDFGGMKGGDDDLGNGETLPEQPYSITVTAEDRGDFRGAPGSGIKLVGVEIEIQANVEEVDPKVLGALAERIADRLPATQIVQYSRHAAFCTDKLKVFMIMSNETERRTDVDLTRERVITREFVCAQVA